MTLCNFHNDDIDLTKLAEDKNEDKANALTWEKFQAKLRRENKG